MTEHRLSKKMSRIIGIYPPNFAKTKNRIANITINLMTFNKQPPKVTSSKSKRLNTPKPPSNGQAVGPTGQSNHLSIQ